MLAKNFWNERYQSGDTPWNVGTITTPLKNFVDKITDKSIDILIPGAGHGHEAVYLHENGFENVYVCDWAPAAIDILKQQIPTFPIDHLIREDFFQLEISVDLILEQTFFCAIPPKLRPKYAKKTATLLRDKGQLAGLLFAREFSKDGPPFGGSKQEYQTYFTPYFNIQTMELSSDSIGPRAGSELFILLNKK